MIGSCWFGQRSASSRVSTLYCEWSSLYNGLIIFVVRYSYIYTYELEWGKYTLYGLVKSRKNYSVISIAIPGSKLPVDTQSGMSWVIFSEIKWWQLSIIHGCSSQKDKKMGANNISGHSIKCNVTVIMMFKLSFAVRCRCLLLNKSMVTGLWMSGPSTIIPVYNKYVYYNNSCLSCATGGDNMYRVI